MSELNKNKNLDLNKNENESREMTASLAGPRRDILFYIKSDYADLADEHSKKIKRTYDFLSFVYGKSNTERLSKIIDEVVKKDMEFVKGKTDEEITDWQKQKNPNYRFEDSFYAKIKWEKDLKLVESMLWHMVLLDILNLKCCDLNLNEPLEKSIENAAIQRSSDRLDFLFSAHDFFHIGARACGFMLYKYSQRIFENLPEKKGINLQQEQLMSKIFACFVKVAFCKFEQSKELNARRIGFHLLEDNFYLKRNDSTQIAATKENLFDYLFLTGELEIMFEQHNMDFFNWLAYDYFYPEFGRLLYVLNKRKSLEERFAEDKNKFIKMYFSFIGNDTVYSRDLHKLTVDVLSYFKDEKLRSSLIAELKKEFKKFVWDENDMKTQDNVKLELTWKPNNYFRDVIERFTDGKEYSNILIEGMSAITCLGTNDVIDAQKNNNEATKNSNIVGNANGSVTDNIKTNKNKTVKDTNSNKNWFVRLAYKVRNFFRSIGSKIRGFFRRQPEKIDIVGLKNNSVISDINSVNDKNFEAPKVGNLDPEKSKDI